MLEVWKLGSNACDTKWRAVSGSGSFIIPGFAVAADGGCERDVVHSVNEGNNASGMLKSVMSNRGLGS